MTPRKGSLAACAQCQRLTLVFTPTRHVCELCANPRVHDDVLVLREGQSFRDWGRTQQLDPSDERVVLVDNMVSYLKTDRGDEIVRRWPWVWDGVQRIERELSGLSLAQVRARINSLLKRLCYARGKRGRQNSGPDAPYWQDSEMFGAKLNTSEGHGGGRQSDDGLLERDSGQRTDKGQRARSGTRDGADHCGNTSTNTSTSIGDENMAIYCEAPQAFELVDRGEHGANITSISEPETSKFDQEKQSIRITFELTGGSFEGQRLSKYYTLSLSKMSGLGKVYRTLLGAIEAGDRVDIERLIGQDCAIQVTHKLGDDDESYAVIQDVFKPSKPKMGSKSSKPKKPALAGAEVPF